MLQFLILHTALAIGQTPGQPIGYYPQMPNASVPTYPVMLAEDPMAKEAGKEEAKPHKHEEIIVESNGNGCESCKEEKECDDCEEEKKSPWCNCGELGDAWDLSSWILGEDSWLDVGGWVSVGYHTNPTGATGNGPGLFNNPGNMFNNQPDRVNLHQAWLYMERKADGKCGLDWGFRVDGVYGIDSVDTQAFGARAGTWDFLNGWGQGNREAFALPVAYAELAYKDFSVIVGKFFTIIGYETVTAPDNFFYSHAHTFFFSEPFTHTGALATWAASDNLEIKAGYVVGNDTGFTRTAGGGAFLGSISYTLNDNITLGYALNFGDLGATGNGYHQTVLATVSFLENFEYVCQSDIVDYDTGAFDSIGVNQYLFYTVNDCLKLGTRNEWYKVQGVSYYNTTVGMNYRPHANVVVRPEYRYQWSPGAQGGNNPIGIPTRQHIFGVDVIFSW